VIDLFWGARIEKSNQKEHFAQCSGALFALDQGSVYTPFVEQPQGYTGCED
jgi:hypothetical protein